VRRLVSLVVLLLFTVPFGLSVTGCSKSTPVVYCNATDSGPVVGQVASISLAPTIATTGESLSYGQIGAALTATAEDCKGNAVSVKTYTYATSDTSLTFADVDPLGRVCAGSWNRNTGTGIQNFTTCTAPVTTPTTHLAYITATADGAVSNAIPVYTHATVASVELTGTSAGAQGSAACTTDPTSDCCASSVPITGTVPPVYTGGTCLSQGVASRLIAKVLDSSGNNITCEVGNLAFNPLGTTNNVVTINPAGVAIANQPGSATITATISSVGSANTAGFFSTCPPVSIVLSAQGQSPSSGPISVPVNQAQSFTTTIVDKNNVQITGLTLQYASTSPQTVVAGATITPSFPGTTTITAICQPGGCNTAPYSQIGLYGNGQPLTSNGITVNTTATSSTVLYVGSTQSQYLFPYDFTTNQQSGSIKLPYIPNSLVISQDGTTIYMGSPFALMVFSTATNTVTTTYTSIVGTVLAVSPDSSTVAVYDPTRQTITLVSSAGAVSSTYNATPATAGGTLRAEWSPDSQTLYITGTVDTSAKPQLLVHSVFNGWLPIPIASGQNYTDVAVMVPAVGAYFATGSPSTEGRSYCSSTSVTAGTPPVTTNSYYPLADVNTATANRLAATADGKHILGATATTLSDIALNPILAEAPCPVPPLPQVTPSSGQLSSTLTTYPLSGITASSINDVVPTSNSAVSFVTYNGSSGILPMYVVPSSGAGTVTPVSLTGGAALAPVAGVFSTTDLNFYVGTSGDNLVHEITLTYPASGTPTAVDSGTLPPNLPCATTGTYGTPVPACANSTTPAIPNLIAQRPKKSTS
jgi:trimeric autotransporter adhesin